MFYNGNEHFFVNGEEINLTMTDFWKWSHPDFLNTDRRDRLAEFIVASSIGLSDTCPADEMLWRPYDMLTGDGYRLQVESASYLQSADEEHPDYISFPISSPDKTDAYIFCLYKATSKSQNPLDLDLWDFFVVSSSVFRRDESVRKSITLPKLQELGIWQCDYYGISEGIKKAMDV